VTLPDGSDIIPPVAIKGSIAGQSRESLLQAFVTWSAAHITGDEKGSTKGSLLISLPFAMRGQEISSDLLSLDPFVPVGKTNPFWLPMFASP
jgi:hypothetical protein